MKRILFRFITLLLIICMLSAGTGLSETNKLGDKKEVSARQYMQGSSFNATDKTTTNTEQNGSSSTESNTNETFQNTYPSLKDYSALYINENGQAVINYNGGTYYYPVGGIDPLYGKDGSENGMNVSLEAGSLMHVIKAGMVLKEGQKGGTQGNWTSNTYEKFGQEIRSEVSDNTISEQFKKNATIVLDALGGMSVDVSYIDPAVVAQLNELAKQDQAQAAQAAEFLSVIQAATNDNAKLVPLDSVTGGEVTNTSAGELSTKPGVTYDIGMESISIEAGTANYAKEKEAATKFRDAMDQWPISEVVGSLANGYIKIDGMTSNLYEYKRAVEAGEIQETPEGTAAAIEADKSLIDTYYKMKVAAKDDSMSWFDEKNSILGDNQEENREYNGVTIDENGNYTYYPDWYESKDTGEYDKFTSPVNAETLQALTSFISNGEASIVDFGQNGDCMSRLQYEKGIEDGTIDSSSSDSITKLTMAVQSALDPSAITYNPLNEAVHGANELTAEQVGALGFDNSGNLNIGIDIPRTEANIPAIEKLQDAVNKLDKGEISMDEFGKVCNDVDIYDVNGERVSTDKVNERLSEYTEQYGDQKMDVHVEKETTDGMGYVLRSGLTEDLNHSEYAINPFSLFAAMQEYADIKERESNGEEISNEEWAKVGQTAAGTPGGEDSTSIMWEFFADQGYNITGSGELYMGDEAFQPTRFGERVSSGEGEKIEGAHIAYPDGQGRITFKDPETGENIVLDLNTGNTFNSTGVRIASGQLDTHASPFELFGFNIGETWSNLPRYGGYKIDEATGDGKYIRPQNLMGISVYDEATGSVYTYPAYGVEDTVAMLASQYGYYPVPNPDPDGKHPYIYLNKAAAESMINNTMDYYKETLGIDMSPYVKGMYATSTYGTGNGLTMVVDGMGLYKDMLPVGTDIDPTVTEKVPVLDFLANMGVTKDELYNQFQILYQLVKNGEATEADRTLYEKIVGTAEKITEWFYNKVLPDDESGTFETFIDIWDEVVHRIDDEDYINDNHLPEDDKMERTRDRFKEFLIEIGIPSGEIPSGDAFSWDWLKEYLGEDKALEVIETFSENRNLDIQYTSFVSEEEELRALEEQLKYLQDVYWEILGSEGTAGIFKGGPDVEITLRDLKTQINATLTRIRTIKETRYYRLIERMTTAWGWVIWEKTTEGLIGETYRQEEENVKVNVANYNCDSGTDGGGNGGGEGYTIDLTTYIMNLWRTTGYWINGVRYDNPGGLQILVNSAQNQSTTYRIE